MWQRTVAQTVSITFHPLFSPEDTPYVANPFLKCKSAIKYTLFHCCLVKLNIKTQTQAALLQTHLVTKRRDSIAATSEAPEDQILIRCVLSKTCNSFARLKQNNDEIKALSSHPSPFPTLGCHEMRRKARCHPLLRCCWCLRGSTYTRIEDLLCWALCKTSQNFPWKIYRLWTIASKATPLNENFFTQKLAVVQWVETPCGGSLNYLNLVVKSWILSSWF